MKTWSKICSTWAILRIVWKARRPSTTGNMKAVVNSTWVKQGYEALTFFGTILTSTFQEADAMNKKMTALKNHEMIHLSQAINCGDSWWKFYRLYLHYWLQGWRHRKLFPNAGYRLNPFEMEAYRHMHDLSYTDNCGKEGASEWRQYAKLNVNERIDYYENRHYNRTARDA